MGKEAKIKIGTKLICKNTYCAGNVNNFTKDNSYIISNVFYNYNDNNHYYYVIEDNKGIRWDFDESINESSFNVEDYFYTLKEIRKMKLDSLFK